MHKLLRGVVITILALAGMIGVSTAAANASTVPVLYNNAAGWSDPTVKPAWVLIGQGGSPGAHTWYWNTWNSTTAKSTGTLWVDNCVPNCASGKESYHKLYVTLYWVKSHNGHPYFYAMSWYTPGYKLPGHRYTTTWLHVNSNGFWNMVA